MTDMDVSRLLLLLRCGPLSVQLFNARPRTRIGCSAVRSFLHTTVNVSFSLIALARTLNGIGTGILNAITPVWATETAEHTSRGQFVAIEFTLNIFGVVVAYWIE